MPGIFISYRREDSSAYAGRLYDHLVNHFGEGSVFMDIDSIQPGEDYLEVIQNTVSSCDVLIAVIGKQWLVATDADGRRLDHPEDLVRVEVATALSRNIRVIPLLVAGAQMPAIRELPEPLLPLARRNAVEISDASFLPSINQLIEALEKVLPGDLPASGFRPPQFGTHTARSSRSPRLAQLNQAAATRPMESPLEKIPKWRRWLLFYRPHGLGGIVCRLLFFSISVFTVDVAVKAFPEGAYKEGGSWVVLGLMIFVSSCFSAGAQWFDVRAIQRRTVRY